MTILTIASPQAPFASPCLLAGRTVLLADDGGVAGGQLEELLWETGASVLLAHNAYQAELIAENHDLVSAVLDAELGVDTIAHLSSYLRCRTVPFVLVSATPELHTGACRPEGLLKALVKLDLVRVH